MAETKARVPVAAVMLNRSIASRYRSAQARGLCFSRIISRARNANDLRSFTSFQSVSSASFNCASENSSGNL